MKAARSKTATLMISRLVNEKLTKVHPLCEILVAMA